VHALATVDWHRVVFDEAQAVENPAGEAARELRPHPGQVAPGADRHADRERARRLVVDP
jgi:hypothetical protein